MPDPKRILLLAATTGYQTRMFAEAGERLGYAIQLATDRCPILDDPWGDHAVPLRFENPEAAASVILRAADRLGGLDGVAAVGDRPAYLAALAAEALGLPYHSPESVLNCGNKYRARERFREAGLNVPVYRRVPLSESADEAARDTAYPCVLKPLGLSASRGVIRANDRREFVAAFDRIRRILASPDVVGMHEDQDRFIQVEDFIEGREFAAEVLMTRGEFCPVALFDKPDPLDGPYFEESIYVTPSRVPEAVRTAIVATTREAVRALGLSHGPVHAEMRVNRQGVWMLEAAARPIGGLCARALRFQSGFGLEEVILRHAAGDDPGELALCDPARGVMMIPIPRSGVYAGVTGVENARSTPGVEDVEITAKEGQTLLRLPDGASYLGFIFAGGSSPADVEASLRTAWSKLKFEILETLPVVR